MIGIVKRFLDTARTDTLKSEVLPAMIEAFGIVLNHNTSSEVHRSLALYITYVIASATEINTGPTNEWTNNKPPRTTDLKHQDPMDFAGTTGYTSADGLSRALVSNCQLGISFLEQWLPAMSVKLWT